MKMGTIKIIKNLLAKVILDVVIKKVTPLGIEPQVPAP
jgi:hypothetical protein